MARDKALFEKSLALVEANDIEAHHLDFNKNGLADADIKRLSQALKSNTTLTFLTLENNLIGDEGARAIAEMLKENATIVSVNLRENEIGEKGAQYLSEALTTNSTVKSLDLGSNKICGAVQYVGMPSGAGFLATMLKSNSSLASLNLYGNKIHSAGIEVIAGALKLNISLTSLVIGNNNIDTAGYAALSAGLRSNNTLLDLDLQKNYIPLDSAIPLAEMMHNNTGLASINLQNCNINDEVAGVLGKALGENKTLTSLNLQHNNIYTNGAKFLLEGLQNNTTLITLNLENNKINSHVSQAAINEILEKNAKSTLKLVDSKKELPLSNHDNICILPQISAPPHNKFFSEPFDYATTIPPSLSEFSLNIPEEYYCPLTKKLFLKAVVAEDGETYEEEAIKTYLENNTVSPVHEGEHLTSKKLIDNRGMQRSLDKFFAEHPQAGKWRYIPIQELEAVERVCKEGNAEGLQNLLVKYSQLIHLCVFENGSQHLLDFVLTQPSENRTILLPVIAKHLTQADWLNLLAQKSAIEWLSCITAAGENNPQVALCFLQRLETALELDQVGPAAFALASIKTGQPWLLRLAISRLENINTPIDDNGNTPLHRAVIERQPHTLQLLLKEGADVTSRNQARLTAKGLAREVSYQQAEHIIAAFKITPILTKYGFHQAAEKFSCTVVEEHSKGKNDENHIIQLSFLGAK